MTDFIRPGISCKNSVTGSKSAASPANAQGLFDNTSATTDTTLTGRDKAVVYYDPQPRVVTLYTLTAGKNPAAAPTAFTLYGSLDGKNWTELDSREDQSFQWGPVHPSLRRSGGEAKALYLL